VSDCIFCRIVRGEIPSQKVFENEQIIIFKDINPVAPTHLLAIPKQHIDNICDPKLLDCSLTTGLFEGVQSVAAELGLTANGFRGVINFGRDAGEAVPHLHFHIIAGRPLGWPPG
jgi:histidine triad (HIT) family protein